MKQQFFPQFLRLFLWLCLCSWSPASVLVAAAEEAAADSPPPVITETQLAAANGVNTDQIWFSLLGRIYDVSESPAFYGPGGPYHWFVGRDAPVPLVTGQLTDEETAKSWDALPRDQWPLLAFWVNFFPPKYPLVGVLEGLYYDSKGQPTAEQARVTAALQTAVAQQQKQKQQQQQTEL